ncbi:hypothetical protein Smp_174230 [Schistosoma mansoni]|uniref:hypothetical protein n=1 Tax=Schistosoma mansoni TaxID=6183 RepID=UPI00022DD111|nr:hypothetical protein Smp_174230 [Schistosoma mansoni]|eukprot:XP_018654349.1 hypothetical protein Smp_174230 [Schistosoma mansoni]
MRFGRRVTYQSKTFEKVLVQNILHGRSIVLCEAIHSISRWKFVKAALPHVLHCGAIMLREKLRDKSAADLPHQKHTLNSCGLSHDRTRLNFSQTETKLLYTLHWILLDAASECEDAELEASNHPGKVLFYIDRTSIPKHSTDRYVHDLASLQLFIYLYAPIIEQLKPTDFDTLKLEAGLRLWIPLMEYCQPNRGTLSSPVKFFTHDSNILSRPVVLNIDGIESPKTSSILNDYIERKSVSLETSEEIPTNVHTVNISDKGSEINNKLPSAVNSFELLVDSASIPHVEANSDESVSSAINIPDNYQPSLTHAHNATGHILRIQPPKATPEYLDDEEEFSEETNSEAAATGTMATTVVVPEMSPPKQEQEHVAPGFERIQKFLNSFMDPYKQLSEKLKYSVADSEFIQPSVGTYCMFATHCDLAVIRCLYCPEWSESGIYWSLCYLFNRLLQIRSEWIKIKPNNRKLLRLRRGNLPSEHLFKWIPGLWSAASSHQARINHITGEMVKEIRSLSLPNISSRCVSSICQRNPSEQCNREFGKDSKNNDLNQHKHTEQQEELCEAQSKSTSNIIQSFPGNSNTPSSIKHSTISSNLDVSLNRKGISCIVGSSASLLNIDKSESNFMKLECSKDRAQQQWQPQQLNTTPVLTDIGLSDSSFTLPLPIVSFGGQQHQNQQQQPAWRSSKRSRITDIKERFTRASKFKSGDSNMKFQPLSSIEAPGMTGINTLIECDQPSVMTGEKQVFYPQTKRSVQTGGENRRLPPNEKPSQGFDTTSNDSEANKRDPPVSSNASSLHIGLKLGLSPCTPSIAVANKPVDNTDTVSNDEQLFAKTLPRSLTDSDIIYHSSEKVDEVPGAAYYITPNGHLDYSVILRSLYWCSTVHTSSRVCFNLVSCLSVLFDLGIFDMKPGACSLKNVSFEKPGHLRRFRKNNHYERNKCSKSFKTPILNKLVARESHTNSNFNNRGGYDSSNLHSGSKVRLHDSTVGFSSSNLSSSRVSVGICSESHESENGDDGDGDLVSKRQFSSRADNESLISEDGITSSVCAKDFSPLGSPQSSIDLEKDPCSTPRIKSSGNIQPRLRNNEKFMSKSAYRPKSRVQQKQVVSCDISNHLIRTHFTLAAEMLIRIIRSVGCRHGHSNSPNFMNHHYHHQQEEQENSVDPNNHFRSLTHDCLIYLHQLNPNLFKRLIIRIVSSSTVADLVEILHSFTGFCLDPVTRCYEHSDQNRKSYLNYGNSFGENDTGQDTRGAEGLIVSYLFGPFVRRLVRCRRELSSQENVSLFSDIRQLFTYIREIHGSTFRKNMLVALLCPVQKICEVTTPKPSTPLPRMSARNSMWLVPRHDKRRSTFNVFIDPLTETESYSSGHRESSWYNLLSRPSTAGRNVRIHSNGSSSTIAASFENEYPSRSKSECPTTDQSTGQMIIEHRWINLSALKEGLFDFAFLLDCCEPGLIPEPQLIAALFDLDAPVLARACLLLECAFLVHRCNRGEWAGWMKFNLPSSFRSSAGFISSNTTNSNNNPSQANENTNNNNHPVDISEIKRVAGYLFYAWGEALGHRLQYFTSLMSSSNSSIITNLDPSGDKVYGSDKSKDVNYRSNVEMEQNFLDDASVNPTGESCPYALLTVGVQLLFEITTYLRETHQRLPQSNPNYDGKCGTDKSISGRRGTSSRRISFAVMDDSKDISDSTNASANYLDQSLEANESQLFEQHPSLIEQINRTSSGDICTDVFDDSTDNPGTPVSEDDNQDVYHEERNLLQMNHVNKSLIHSNPLRLKSRQGHHSRYDETIKSHTSVRRSVSAALSAKKSLKSNTLHHALAFGDNETYHVHDYTSHMPWVDAVIEFANYATLNRGLNVTCDTGTTLPVSSNVIRQHRPNNSRSENSSDQDSSHLDSTEDLSDSDVIHQQQVNPAYIKNKINTLKSLSNIIQSKDSLTGLGKSTDNDLDVHNFLLMHQGALTASSGRDFWKARSKLFIKSAKRKESNIFGPSSSRENMNLLTKIRMKSFNRSINPSSFENDTPGLTGLINLSMLAGAGAGLLKSSRQSISLNPPLLGIEADEASETSPGFEDDDGFKSQIRKPVRFRKHHSGELPIQCYLDTHIKNLCSSGFNLLNKAALLLTNNQLAKMLPLAWELLLETDTEMSSSAACFILFCGVRCPQIVQEMILDEMRHEKPTQRFNAILRFRTLWCHRFHVWSRLEENAPSQLRVPPSFIEFVLPSPTLGYPGFEAPDPVWQIRKGTSAEEVQLKQNEATVNLLCFNKTFVTASTSRRKQQQELLARAIATETMRRREARQSFHLTTCPVLERATIEPAFSKEHRDEGNIDDNEDRWLNGFHSLFPSQPLQQAQLVFPSALCSASVLLINLLDDTAINEHGTAVNTIAEYVIFNCLLEDTPLFLRFIFERLTRIKNKDELIFILRKMIQRLPELPMQTAHALFNNLVGYIMFHIRTPSFNAPQSIASALSVLHLVIPYVQNIYFKDLKQTMRREQIDSTLLLTANLPCAKQFNVFDNSIGVAQLVRLQDENKFEDILKDVLSASDILEDERCSYYLCDERSNIIRNSSHYIRDFYSFKRNHTPKLRLRQYDKKHGMYLLQQNALSLKFQEIGKVSFTLSVLRCTPTAQIPNHVFFLHEELTKLPSFPRKALESDFNLYDWPTYGRPLFALDTIHKLSWCHLISSLFMMMPKTYPWSSDLQIFLNVYNGTLILHAEDSSVLRQCLAFFIQCCYQFKTVFATTGYSGIVPTLVRVYNQNTHNPVLTQAIEFTFRQFYVMHRTPFILQLLGCIANYVTTNNEIIGVGDEFYRIQPGAVYRLLRVISRPLDDNLRILELCNIQKPLEALDFCYDDEEANWSILEVINLCVAVIVYAPDSYRSRQMLIILQALMPLILKDLSYICAEEGNGTDPKKAELSAIQKISIAMRQLISTAEFMSSNFKSLDKTKYNETAVKITRNELCNEINTLPVNKGFPLSVSSNVSRERDIQSNQMLRNPAAATSGHHRPTAYEPREAVLQLACEFLSTCSGRLLEMEEKQRISDLLDAKSHMRLADITQFMLKQVSNSPDFLVSSALQRYFLEVLPVIDWSHESLRSCKAVECLLGRLNRTLPKMLEFAIRSKATHHWNEFVKLIRSVYYILKRNRSVAHMKEIRVLAEILKKAIVFDVSRCLSSFPKSRLDIQPNHATSRYGRPSFGEVLFGITSQESSSISASVGVPKQSNKMKHIPLNGDAGSYCSPRHSNQEAWPETDLDDSDKYPCQFTTEVIRLLSLFLQILGPHCSLKDLCERISPEYNIRFPTLREGGFQTLVIYLNNLILPMLFRGCAGRKDSPTLSRDNVFYALDVCITALFATDYASNADGQRSIYHLTTISNSTPQQQQTCESSQSGPLSGKLKDKSNKSQTTGFELRTNPSISLNRQATGSIAQDNTSTITTSNNNSASIKLINLSNLSTDFEGGSYASLIRLLSPSLVKILPDESGPLNTSVQITVSNKCQGKQDSFQLKSRPSVIPNLNKTSILTQKSRPQVYYSKLLDPTSINLGFPIDKIKSFKAEFAHRLGFLGLKLILAAYTRHAAVRMKLLVAALTQLALNGQSGIQLWKFFDFLVTYRPPLFVHLLPFIRFKMALLQCASQGEQAYQQIVNQKLIGLHLPIPQTVASILRSLSNELQIINSDIKAFSKRSYNEITLPRTSSLHDSLRRLRSSDNTSSVSARSNKHAKLTKVVSKNTDEYTHKSSHKVSSKDQVNQKPQSYVLASVTSNSTCSVDYRDENTIGISNLDRHLLGRKSFNQEFRQTTGVRDPRKRIHAHEGSCLLVRTRDYGQTDPILTGKETKLTGNAQMYKNLRIDTLKARLSNDSSADNQSENSLVSEGLIAPLGPAAAAAIASSLYGSGAPYLHAQVRARQELASLVRIPAPKLNSREKLSEIDFAFVPEVSGDDNDKKSPIQQKSKYQSNQTKVEHKVTGNFMLKLENLEEKSPDEKDQLRDITKSPITTSVVVGTANISTTKTATEAEAPRAVQVTGDKISPMISRKSKINYV